MLIAKPCPSLPIVSSRLLTCSSPLNVVGNHKFPFPKVAETIHSFVSDMLGCPGSMGHWIHRVVSYYSWLISCGVIHLHLTNLTCPTLDLDLHALTRSKTVFVGGRITNPQKFIDNKSTGKTHQEERFQTKVHLRNGHLQWLMDCFLNGHLEQLMLRSFGKDWMIIKAIPMPWKLHFFLVLHP